MDWLQQNNPMQVHWQDKWLQFSQGNSLVTPKGICSTVTMGPPITVHQLQALIKDNSVLYQVQVNLNTDPAPDM